MRLRIYVVDAFATQVFKGNPAAVVPLREWLDDALMQSIAAENNLSETAFFVAKDGNYHIRWFTPSHEVKLCGHATLASAFVIFPTREEMTGSLRFESLSGILEVSRRHETLTMSFPRINPERCDIPKDLIKGLQLESQEVLFTESDPNYYVVYNNEADVRSIHPDLTVLERLHPYGVVVTAIGTDVDFVSRYFAPSYGIPEDPVTGSIHCALTPYWATRLGKPRLHARQVSKRGGELYCEDLQHGVLISGQAVIYMEGEISV
jgi:PhzF family phenazine biosynthesis protein